jgi:DNA processing protein
MNDRVITPADEEWPERLNQIGPARPAQLYVRGQALEAPERTIGIVGARQPTVAGLAAAERFATGLAEAGFTIVSGLALGIDAEAHRACLQAGGYTIAVLGCGLDVDYPVRNKSLKKRIGDVGTIVTEYPNGTAPDAFRFPQRNRIIAGIARAVLYVEGGKRSGGLITARAALDFDRAVFAVPGSIRNPLAAGPNELIRTGEAALVTEVKHVCDELEPGLVWDSAPRVGLHHRAVVLEESETRVLGFLDDKPVSVDAICSRLGMRPGEAALALSRLEIRSFAVRRRSGYELADAGARARAALLNGEGLPKSAGKRA